MINSRLSNFAANFRFNSRRSQKSSLMPRQFGRLTAAGLPISQVPISIKDLFRCMECTHNDESTAAPLA